MAAIDIRLFIDQQSSTYTYFLSSQGEGIIIDPVEEKADLILQTAREMGITVIATLETHTHADHVTGAHRIREQTNCDVLVSQESGIVCATKRFSDGDKIVVGDLILTAMYTPGHTDDSYCFHVGDHVFTGDTLLIRSTGRTDFQNGDARLAYRSLVTRLLTLDDATIVHPGHDYKGLTSSTIGEERRFNPRLRVRDADEYVDLMAKLNLPRPAQMDVAIPRNRRCGAP